MYSSLSFLTALFMPVPYVMELEEFSWSECLSYSMRLMKKNSFHLFVFIVFICLDMLYIGL